MFNVGGGEILVILLVALIVLGPQRLPEAARKVGNIVGELRRMSSSFQNEIRTALDEADSDRPRSRRPTASSSDVASAITAASDNAGDPNTTPPTPPSGSADDGGDDARAAS